MHESSSRLARYKESTLSLTTLGKALLTQADNFSRHQPDRSLVGRHQIDQ
jgi:hypothetical protein